MKVGRGGELYAYVHAPSEVEIRVDGLKMRDHINIKIGGAAGAGIKSVGSILAKTLMRHGFQAFQYPEYPSLIRGGHNVEQIYASTEAAFSQIEPVDILLALDKNTVDLHRTELVEGAVILFDSQVTQIEKLDQKFSWLDVPMLKLARQHGSDVMANNAGVGAVLKLLGLKLETTKAIIAHEFADKKKAITIANHRVLQAGYQSVKKRSNLLSLDLPGVDLRKREELLMTGNEAVGLGAIAAGIGLYVAYPMTPASSVLHFLAANQEKYGFVVRQPGDEIAAVNLVIGAMHAGVRAMTGTSGGGFALMNESLALSGMTEIPLVILEVQRPGPATGLPTWTEQGDLEYVIHAGHGEFPRIVLAPGDLQEAFDLTVDGFNLAERYQTPVIILADKYLGESAMTAPTLDQSRVTVDRGAVLSQANLNKRKNFQRYELTKTGVSPRSLPGMKNGVFVANSDEHQYHGLVDETSQMRRWQTEKRLKKGEVASGHLPGPKLIGPQQAEVTMITWGSSKLPARQAMETGNRKQETRNKINLLHFNYLWPLNREAVKKTLASLKSKRTLLVEGNATGQFQSMLREQLGFEPDSYLRRYDGRPFYPEEIIDQIKKIA